MNVTDAAERLPMRPSVLRHAWMPVLLGVLLASGDGLAQSGARLAGPEITQLLNGKQVTFRGSKMQIRGTAQDPEYFVRSDGVVTDIVIVFREDRSFRRLCTYRTRDGSTGTCGGAYQGVGTGIWRVSGDTLCLGEVIVPGRETCYTVERADSKFRCRYVSGGLAKGTIRGLYDGLEFELTQ